MLCGNWGIKFRALECPAGKSEFDERHSSSFWNSLTGSSVIETSYVRLLVMNGPLLSPNLAESLGEPRLRDALERVRPRLVQVKEEDFVPLNVDPLDATSIVRGALPAIMRLRPEMVTHLATFELRNLDELETYALALMQTHGLYLCAKSPPEELAKLVVEAVRLRDKLLVDVSALTQHEEVSGKFERVGRGRQSHRELAGDLLALSNLLKNQWPIIATKCALREQDLDYAEVLGDRLNGLLGLVGRDSEDLVSASRLRQQAFTVFARAYDQVRKAVGYLRWERGDADLFAPALRRGRAGKRNKRQRASDPVTQ
jgi:hypothetical protein